MVKEYYMIKMEILYMKVIMLMTKEKEMENLLMKMVIIILDNLKIINQMEKELYMIKMEGLYMKEKLLMTKEKEKENLFQKMADIIQVNLKIIY